MGEIQIVRPLQHKRLINPNSTHHNVVEADHEEHFVAIAEEDTEDADQLASFVAESDMPPESVGEQPELERC